MPEIMQIIFTALSLGSFYALAALGIGLLFGVIRIINFGYGSMITLGGYLLLAPSLAIPPQKFLGALPTVPLVISTVLIMAFAALVADRLVFRPLRSASPSTVVIASFAMGYVIQNLIIMFYGGRPKGVDLWSGLNQPFFITDSVSVPTLQIVITACTTIILVLLTVFLRLTPTGVQMRAAAEDMDMARVLGVNSNRVMGLALGLSGGLAGIAALFNVAQKGVLDYEMGVTLMIYGFVSTVVGGLGSLPGAVAGAYVIGIASVIISNILPSELRGFRDAFLFALIALILVARPKGLFPPANSRERV